MNAGGGARRLDKWLGCARLFRTRRAASDYVEQLSVRIIRDKKAQRIEKPGFLLKEGDEIAFFLGNSLIVVRVMGFSERRGPAAEAAMLLERVKRI